LDNGFPNYKEPVTGHTYIATESPEVEVDIWGETVEVERDLTSF
jgi:hypothetical protein